MKEEWKSASVGSGGQYVTVIGGTLMLELLVGSSTTQEEVWWEEPVIFL